MNIVEFVEPVFLISYQIIEALILPERTFSPKKRVDLPCRESFQTLKYLGKAPFDVWL